MTKAELIERIMHSQDLPEGMTKKCVSEILDVAFAEMADYFARAKITRSAAPRFTYPGFGTFTKKRRPARRGVNPQTLEPMNIEGFETLDFKPGLELKRALNRGAEVVEARSAPRAKPDARATRVAAAPTVASPSGRRLALREAAEIEALDEAARASLPNAPLQRVSSAPRGRTTRTKVGS